MAKAKVTIASLQEEIVRLQAELAIARGVGIEQIITESGQRRSRIEGIGHGGAAHNFTPSAVDAIRLFTWAAKKQGLTKKEINAELIRQGFTPATVRARVGRIFDGTDESCYSDAIRMRLGLGDDLEADEVEEDPDLLDDETLDLLEEEAAENEEA